MNSFLKYLFNKYVNKKNKWYPILSVYYLTYQCDFKCSYCSDGRKTPYYKLKFKEQSGKKVISILKAIRKNSSHLVLTGGEPLKHHDLEYILKELPNLKFKTVVFTTNGYLIEKFIPLIAKSITSLVFSIDTLDCKKADSLYGLGQGVFSKIKANIEIASKYKNSKYQIYISSVATPENLSDLYDVYNFSKINNFIFAVQPQLIGVKVHEELKANKNYIRLYNYIIDEKKKGSKIYGTIPYLEYMKNIDSFECYPFTMLVVSPEGNVFYPCLELGNFAGNILNKNNLHKIREEGEKLFGPQPDCDNRCQSACSLSFFTLIKYPLSISQDFYLSTKRNIKNIFLGDL